jgi:DNA-binding transcriptional ArsR family regulator
MTQDDIGQISTTDLAPTTDMAAFDPKIEQAAGLMLLLSQPMRLQVLCGLLEGPQSVQSLADVCGLSQPAMSHHLRKLRLAGVVETRRAGQTVYYSICSAEVEAVIAVLHRLYCAPDQPI